MNKSAIATILATSAIGFLKSTRGSRSKSENIEIRISGVDQERVNDIEHFLQNLQLNNDQTMSLKLFNIGFQWPYIKKLIDIIPTIPKLTEVEVYSCSTWIDDLFPAFCNCITIKKLTISRSGLMEIPDCIGNLVDLEELTMEYNWDYHYNQENPGYTVDIPDSIGNLKKLKKIVIHESATGNIPSDIGNLTNLEHLEIRNGNVRTLPNEIGNLSSLKYLNLSGNKIHRLNANIGNLSKLEELNLDYNMEIRPHPLEDLSLDELPEEIGNLTNLKVLNLNRLLIKSLPESMNNLVNLKELSMDYPHPSMYTLPYRLFMIDRIYIMGLGRNSNIAITEEGFNSLMKDGHGHKAIEIAKRYGLHPKAKNLDRLRKI